ncbi:Nn.00g085890.m01.CDS01 [Neocucurbitaria sp. VM-36]
MATPKSSVNDALASPRPSNRVSALDAPVSDALSLHERGHTKDLERAITAVRYQHRPPTFNQPSRALPEAFDAALLSHYVELNKSKRTYAPEIQWLVHLPRIHSNANRSAVRLSLRALSMAFYGKLHQDPSILVDSWRCIPDEEEVLVPLILALYEVYVGATSSGSMAHMAAAAEIMNMRGPSNCKSGVIWPLFKGIRNSDAYNAIVFNKSSVYSSPEWMTLPFIDMPRDAHQSLTDIALMVPHCLALLQIQGTLRVFFETPIPAHVDDGAGRELTCKLIADLDRWAITYPNLTKIARGTADTAASGAGLSVTNEDAKDPGLPDTFIALIASNYVAMRLVLNMLMHKMETQPNTPPATPGSGNTQYFEKATQCSQAILKGAAEVEKAQTPGFDLLRSIFPVLAVACTAPTPELRDGAMEMMQRWGARIGGLVGVWLRI